MAIVMILLRDEYKIWFQANHTFSRRWPVIGSVLSQCPTANRAQVAAAPLAEPALGASTMYSAGSYAYSYLLLLPPRALQPTARGYTWSYRGSFAPFTRSLFPRITARHLQRAVAIIPYRISSAGTWLRSRASEPRCRLLLSSVAMCLSHQNGNP